jgi:hypothetical protein
MIPDPTPSAPGSALALILLLGLTCFLLLVSRLFELLCIELVPLLLLLDQVNFSHTRSIADRR